MTENNNEVMISIDDLCLSFGGLQAINSVDLDIRAGEILAIIGPNGAGKTCILNCINGFYHPHKGKILYRNRDLTDLKPNKIASLGIARTFQNIELYSGLSALDNLMAARHIHMRHGALLYWSLKGSLLMSWKVKS